MRGAVPEPQGRLAESRREATRDWKPRLIGQHGGGVDFLDVSYILFQKTTSLILRNRIPSSPSCSPSFYFPALELRWAKFIRNPLNLSHLSTADWRRTFSPLRSIKKETSCFLCNPTLQYQMWERNPHGPACGHADIVVVNTWQYHPHFWFACLMLHSSHSSSLKLVLRGLWPRPRRHDFNPDSWSAYFPCSYPKSCSLQQHFFLKQALRSLAAAVL